MGIYLSTPSSEVFIENGEGYISDEKKFKFAVGEMQGWRKNMEDAHIAAVNVNNKSMSIFGVFDGHGGKEVAKFTKLKYVEILTNLPSFLNGDYEQALKESFHKIDELLEDKQYDPLLKEYRALPNPSDSMTKKKSASTKKSPDEILLDTVKAKASDDSTAAAIVNNNNLNEKKSLSTSQAVDLIRNILNNAKENPNSGDADVTSENNNNDEPILLLTDGGNIEKDDSAVVRPPEPPIEGVSLYGERIPNSYNAEYLASKSAIDGSKMCTLKDHRVMAGCTAIVAFAIGTKLYVANAGDSRGVLCRKNGIALPLSEDHKPQQDREMSRITAAGGFVNMVGRINGNLNLSRSLGDLKYKQNPHIAMREQMITAEPDVSVTEIDPDDRFFLLACDGVWDCLSCQQACDFVSEKLDNGLSVDQIVKEVCSHCLADDPRSSAGIGGDNMTCLIVMLNQ